MASHPVRPPRPLDFSATDGSAGQGGEDAGASPAPAFAALNKVLDLPGLPSAPTPYPLSEDGKYYKVNLLHRNFLPPTASATFSSGVHQLGAAAPTFVFDGGDQAFTAVTDTPGDPNVVVTLLVDMGQYFSVGAVRPLYPPFLGGGYPFRQRIRLATKLGPNPDWRTPVEESPVPTTDTTLSFDATPGRFLELTMIGNGCNLYELFVYPSAQTSPTPTSANGYDLTSLGSTSTVNDNYFPLGLHWPLSWPAGGFYPKTMPWGPTGDAVATIDLGEQYPVSRLQLNFFWSTPWVNGGRLEVGSTPDMYTTVADSGPGHYFFPWPHTLNFPFSAQPVRYIRATDYFIPGSGLSGQTLWAVHAFADPGQHLGYFPLSADGKYFGVNLLRRPTSDAQPGATVAYANGATTPGWNPVVQDPNNVVDGDDNPFIWSTPGPLPDATVTIIVDLKQVQSIGAVRQYYWTGPTSSSMRIAETLSGPWKQVLDDTPITPRPYTLSDTTISFEATSARYVELTMKGTPAGGLAGLQELMVYPSSAAEPAPSSGSHLDLSYLTGLVYTPNANMGIAGGPRVHVTGPGYGYYVKSAAQGGTGDGTITIDLGQKFQISEVDLSYLYNQTWPAGGKLDVDDGAGNWVTVFESGHGTPLGLASDGPQKITFAARATRYVRLTAYFDGASSGLLTGIEVFGENVECVPNCNTKACGDDLSDGCGTMCPGVCGGGQVGCTTDAQCQAGLVCRGHVAGSAVATVCVAETCLISPQLLGCGYSGAPCGPSCTKSPICSSDDQCPSGYVCGMGNGHAMASPAQMFVSCRVVAPPRKPSAVARYPTSVACASAPLSATTSTAATPT